MTNSNVTNNTERHYTYTHKNPSLGINYYRIKQIDYDGQYSYSNIASVVYENETRDISIYPNPASDVIYLDHPDILYWDKTELINMTGHVVRSSRYNNMLTVADLPDGVYVLRLWKDGKSWVRKIIIHKS